MCQLFFKLKSVQKYGILPSLNKDSVSINIVTEFKSMELEDTNAMVLDAFGEYLEKVKGLEPKSVRKHQDRVNTFIQTYLR